MSDEGASYAPAARLWWQDVVHSDWTAFALSEDLVRERCTALLTAVEELSTREPVSTPVAIAAQVRAVGYHDQSVGRHSVGPVNWILFARGRSAGRRIGRTCAGQ